MKDERSKLRFKCYLHTHKYLTCMQSEIPNLAELLKSSQEI